MALVYAFIVGLASIHWLMKWLANHSTFIFIYYRIALGLLLIGLLAALWNVERTGQGQVVDSAMVDGVVTLSQKIWSFLAP